MLNIKLLYTGIIISFLTAVTASIGSTRPLMQCPRIDNPPIIDGKITDKCWQKATHITDFMNIKGDKLANEQTEVYTCYDSNKLYIAFKCFDSQIDKVQATKTTRDADVWTDDCVDVFLDPDLSRRYFYQLIVNSIGTQQDINVNATNDTKWNIKWQSKSYKDQTNGAEE